MRSLQTVRFPITLMIERMKRIGLMLAVAALTLGGMVWVATRFGARPAFGQGTEQRGYNIGDAVAGFSLRNTGGTLVSLNDFAAQKGLIVVFTSNHCPFSKAYEARLVALNNHCLLYTSPSPRD